MDIKKTINSLKRNRFSVQYFETSQEATDYLNSVIDQRSVGFGDSITLKVMNLFEQLSSHNTVFDPNQSDNNDDFLKLANQCLNTEIFITSVNAMSETGEMVNIDGTGNRVAGSLFGHQKVYFVVGTNKIEESLEKAIWRARNIAGPKNAMKYNLKTPCVLNGGDHCYDCNSPDRICNTMNIYMKKMDDIDDVEVVLINETMGY